MSFPQLASLVVAVVVRSGFIAYRRGRAIALAAYARLVACLAGRRRGTDLDCKAFREST